MTEALDRTDQSKVDSQDLAQYWLVRARTDGVEPVGPNGLLNQRRCLRTRRAR